MKEFNTLKKCILWNIHPVLPVLELTNSQYIVVIFFQRLKGEDQDDLISIVFIEDLSADMTSLGKYMILAKIIDMNNFHYEFTAFIPSSKIIGKIYTNLFFLWT